MKLEIRSLVESEVGGGIIEALKKEIRVRIAIVRNKNRSRLGISTKKPKQDPVVGIRD